MKRMMILVLTFGFVFGVLSLFQTKEAVAGDYFIDEVRFNGDCVGVKYGSTEDDSHDRGGLVVLVYAQHLKTGNWKKLYHLREAVGGLQARSNYYKEFCGIRLYRGRVKVIVKIYHNRNLDDSRSEIFNM